MNEFCVINKQENVSFRIKQSGKTVSKYEGTCKPLKIQRESQFSKTFNTVKEALEFYDKRKKIMLETSNYVLIKFPEKKKQKRKCGHCGRVGHYKPNCPYKNTKIEIKTYEMHDNSDDVINCLIEADYYNFAKEITPYYKFTSCICPDIEVMAPKLCGITSSKTWKNQFIHRIKQYLDKNKLFKVGDVIFVGEEKNKQSNGLILIKPNKKISFIKLSMLTKNEELRSRIKMDLDGLV
jgi:hypothetical protein